MEFTDVIETGHVAASLKEKHGVVFARVPFDDGHGQTSYWVSSDGRHVYVGIEFGDWCQVKEIRIYPAGYRSISSAPCFKRRNSNGAQCYVALPQAVYGAFVLKDRIPKFKLKFRDGNIGNCDLDNLEGPENSALEKNIYRYKDLYRREYDRVVAIVQSKNPETDRQKIKDYVSDGFLRVCMAHNPARDPMALWVYCAKENLWQDRAKEKTVYVEFYHPESSLSDNGDDASFDLKYLPQYLYDTAMLLYQGFNQLEIAEILGVTQTCISMRLTKIRQMISKNNAR